MIAAKKIDYSSLYSKSELDVDATNFNNVDDESESESLSSEP